MDDQAVATTANGTNVGFTITRIFDAPRATLWNAWTDPAMVPVWWHPRGVSTPADSVTLDVRVGGRYRYIMVNDATGETYPTGGIYREIDEPSRLVYTWGSPEDDDATVPVITVTLNEHGSNAEQTEMIFRVDGIAGVPGDDFVYDGWASAFELLDESLA